MPPRAAATTAGHAAARRMALSLAVLVLGLPCPGIAGTPHPVPRAAPDVPLTGPGMSPPDPGRWLAASSPLHPDEAAPPGLASRPDGGTSPPNTTIAPGTGVGQPAAAAAPSGNGLAASIAAPGTGPR